MQIIKYAFQQHGDERGMLVALEEYNDIPFEIKRVYYMYDTKEGVTRGYHAHKSLEQILICIHGSCKIRLDNGREKKIVSLEKPYEGLYVPNNMWRERNVWYQGRSCQQVETEYETCSNNEWQEVSRGYSTIVVANIMGRTEL